VVSSRSRALFAARARARRWLSWRPVLLTAAALTAVALGAWVVLSSSLLAAREITVVGADRLAPAAVEEALGKVLGTPLARLDTGALADRVEQLPLVHDAEVVRAWPGTLEVRLVERVPIAAVPDPAGGVRLVDDEGVVVAHEEQPPADLPLVQVDVPTAGPDALRAASAVLSALPDDLRTQVEQVGATSPDDVRMTLRGGGEVVWGSAADSELKARVLQTLRSQPAAVYDVSSPLTPVTR
jgi:cell division protein FtsQ